MAGDDGPLAVNHAAERALLMRALSYPLVIEQVVRTARPHSLAEFLYDLATAVSKFYEECPVLDAAPGRYRVRTPSGDFTCRRAVSCLVEPVAGDTVQIGRAHV